MDFGEGEVLYSAESADYYAVGFMYKKMFARDHCLAFVEIWCKSESTDPRQWTERQIPYKPYILFERVEDTTNCYMDPAGIRWIKRELVSLIKHDPRYINKAVRTFYTRIDPIKSIWEKERPLTLSKLVQFMADLRYAWPWFDAIWWLLEVAQERNMTQLRLLKKARFENEGIGISSNEVIYKSIEKIYPRVAPYAYYITGDEVKSGIFPSKRVLTSRKHYFYADRTLFIRKKVADVEKYFHIKIEHSYAGGVVSEIKGQSAYPGHVFGQVRRIMGRRAMRSFKTGEILVSSMTNPVLLPAIKKAAALVTDEGGITSHAAIIARELHIPAVLGTQIATRVLKDGDRVEVDATRGIVRKI